MPDQNGIHNSCFSCEANLKFKIADSYCLVCPACQSLNYRQNKWQQLTPPKLKKTQLVQEDMSIIRLGTTGNYQNQHFEVIGRMQYFFQERYRNHWFLSYTQETTGWLGDWDGNYSLFQKTDVVRNKFENPAPGKKVQINNAEYFTEQIDISRMVLAEGELGSFYLNEEKFITLEFINTTSEMAVAHIFTDKKIEAFTGHYLDISELNLQNLRHHHDWV